MLQRGYDASAWTCETVPHPKQRDSSSCGVYALKFAECILRQQPIDFSSDEESVNNLRKHIAVTLLQDSGRIGESVVVALSGVCITRVGVIEVSVIRVVVVVVVATVFGITLKQCFDLLTRKRWSDRVCEQPQQENC
ncbi:hypothetical protein PO909_026774 [Leuciscus waleckii]